MKSQAKLIYFHSRKSIWKCRHELTAILSRPQCVKCLYINNDSVNLSINKVYDFTDIKHKKRCFRIVSVFITCLDKVSIFFQQLVWHNTKWRSHYMEMFTVLFLLCEEWPIFDIVSYIMWGRKIDWAWTTYYVWKIFEWHLLSDSKLTWLTSAGHSYPLVTVLNCQSFRYQRGALIARRSPKSDVTWSRSRNAQDLCKAKI